MKARWSFCLLVLASVHAVFAGEEGQAPADANLVGFAQRRTDAIRVTESPVRMHDRVSRLCNDLFVMQKTNSSGQLLQNPHEHKFAHVFVSTNGAFAMRTNAVFPVGSIIIKEKFSDAEGKQTELYTGMIKRTKGYNSECGDWEFFTLSADATKVTSRGKLQACMDCHVAYKNSDYVTKRYVTFSR